jgi:hypothetical protein
MSKSSQAAVDGMNKARGKRKRVGRPKKGDEYPIAHKQARRCKWCDAAENFKANRSAVTVGIVKVEWLRCQECLKVTRFETSIK